MDTEQLLDAINYIEDEIVMLAFVQDVLLEKLPCECSEILRRNKGHDPDCLHTHWRKKKSE